MNTTTVTLTDATGSKSQEARVPADAPAIRVLARLVDVLNLPSVGPDGRPLAYKFHHQASGRQLRDEDTFASVQVADGDTLRLVAEITAG